MAEQTLTETREAELLRQCQEGDAAAFEPIVKRYASQALGAARLLLGNYEDAREASQDAFVKAWRNIDSFDPSRPFYPWYSTVLRRVCIDRLRRRKDTAPLDPDRTRAGKDSDPALTAQRNELRDRVQRAVAELPIKHREVIVMQHFEGLSYSQMADALEVPEGTIMSRLYYARRALRDSLSDQKP